MASPDPSAARGSLDPSSQALRLFDEFLARVEASSEAGETPPDFEHWLAGHPEQAEELRILHAEWNDVSQLAREVREEFGGIVERASAAESSDSWIDVELERLRSRAQVEQNYEFRGEIGRGGMGTVHRVYDSALRRELALKVLHKRRQGSGSPSPASLLARFLVEAQITGQLDHPGIVPVHEMGLNQDGELYFTMALVRGRDLREVFSRARAGTDSWSVPRALGVLLKVCETLAYAHNKGVVHRDLKPANIMVGRFGEVYVMDWGLAKVLEEEAGAEDSAVSLEIRTARDSVESSDSGAVQTMDGAVLGTPAYMSPEQARGELHRIGPRSDVYAVGSMLYELFTSKPPYLDSGSARSRDVLKRVRAGPPRPLAELAPSTPPELLAICSRAMARDTADRHQGMLELAEDLRAFLERRVVQSYESGSWAQLRKWIARNRLVAASWAALFLVALLGLGTVIGVQWRAQHRLQVANAATEHEAEVLAGVVRWIESVFELSGPDRARGHFVTAREVIDRAAAALGHELDEDPHVLARLSGVVGSLYEALGSEADAIPVLRIATAASDRAFGESDKRSLEIQSLLALTLGRSGQQEESWSIYDRLLERMEQTRPSPDAESRVLNHYGASLKEARRPAEAETVLERAIELAALGGETSVRVGLSASNNLATLYFDERRFEEARTMITEVWEERRARYGGDHPDTLVTQANLGSILREIGELERAREVLEENRRGMVGVLGPRHPQTLTAGLQLAMTWSRLGQFDTATELYEQIYALCEDLLPGDPLRSQIRRRYANSLTNMGRWAEAEPLCAEELGEAREFLPAEDLRLVEPIYEMARCGVSLDKSAKEELYLEALAILRRHPDERLITRLSVLNQLGRLYLRTGEPGKAELLHEEAYQLAVDRLDPGDPFSIRATMDLADAHRALEEFGLAEQLYVEALESARDHLPETSQVRWTALHRMAEFLYAVEDYEESRALLDELLQHASPQYANYGEYQSLDRRLERAIGQR